MPLVEFVGQSSQDSDNKSANTSRLINCYEEITGGRTGRVLKSVPGMQDFAALTSPLVRDMAQIDGVIYAVAGGDFFSVTSAGVVTDLGNVTDSVDTTISGNNGVVTIAADGNYYTWDGATLTEPTAGAFSDFGSVTFIGQRTVLTEAGGRRVQWSDVADPDTLGGLDFATTEARDDNNLRAVAFGSFLWIFKERSLERWYLTGQDDIFAPLAGGALDVGLKAYRLITQTPRSLFFVGSDNKVYLASGDIQPVSTIAVETAIFQGSPTACFYYQDEGHEFCVIKFDDRASWVYDISTGRWHERAEGLDLGPWSATASVEAFGSFYVGDAFGRVRKLSQTQLDGTTPLIRQATGNSLWMEGNRFRVKKMEILARMGRGDVSVALEVSEDFGETFGDPKVRSFGATGRYENRAVWRNLGQFRQITPRISWSDAAQTPIDAICAIEVS